MPAPTINNASAVAGVRACLFDVFGTVVDWRSSITADLTAFARANGISGANGAPVDWAKFTDDWRGLYQPAMEEVRSGRRAWTILDVLHRESLDTLLARHGITGLGEDKIAHMNRAWHRLSPWPDTVEGLTRLKTKVIIGSLSNGNIGLLTRMAKHAGLPWDVVLGAETSLAYKPLPQAYLGAAAHLNLKPSEVMLVAAHNGDLAAASVAGLRTAFVARPSEYGPGQDRDFQAIRAWDIVAASFNGVAEAFGG
jgi:2-haloacid dehalogenase